MLLSILSCHHDLLDVAHVPASSDREGFAGQLLLQYEGFALHEQSRCLNWKDVGMGNPEESQY